MVERLKSKIKSFTSDNRFSDILRGTVWALSARIVATALGLALSVVVVRFYGADVMGILAVLQSFLGLAIIFTVLGTQTSILRLIPEQMVKYSATAAFLLYRKIQYIVIGVSICTGVIFFLSANFIAEKIFSKPHLSYYFGITSLFIVFYSIMVLNTQAARGLRLIRMFSLIQILPSAINLTCLLIFTYYSYIKDNPIYSMLAGLVLTGAFGVIIINYSFKKKMKQDDIVNYMSIRDILSISIPMLLSTTMSFIIGQTGIIILGMLRSEEEVGYYAVAVKLATLTSFVLGAINTMVGPKFSELFHSGKIEELFYVARKAARLVFWTTIPILIIFAIFGKFILVSLYGEDYSIVYVSLLIVVFGQFVNSISGCTSMLLNMTGNQLMYQFLIMFSALLSIASNAFLIPRYGMIGAAVSTMLSVSFLNISSLIFIKNKFDVYIGYFPSRMYRSQE